MLHRALQNEYLRTAIAVFGSFLCAISMNWFIVPMGLYTGGILGVCQLVRSLLVDALNLSVTFDFSGILYMAINIPIFLLAWRSLGKGIMVRTLICTVSNSFFLSAIPLIKVPVTDELLTNCIIGGILTGVGCGILYTCGSSSGGLDIIGMWLIKRGSQWGVGRFNLFLNALIYALCAILFGVRTAVYSIISTALSAVFMDRLHQQNINMQALIFTREKQSEIAGSVLKRLGRGVTYWEGKGAYTESDIRILCVCISKYEEADLRRIVREKDPNAFLILQEGVSISGNFEHRVAD